MRRSLTITLLLLVLLPLGLLGWLGRRLVVAEQEEVRQAFRDLLAGHVARGELPGTHVHPCRHQ